MNLNLENVKKNNSETNFPFWDNCIWKCSLKSSLLRKEYLLSALNGLTNRPRIFHSTHRDFFNLNCHNRNKSMWWRSCPSAWNNVSADLTRYLSKDLLKRDFLNVYLTTFFGVSQFKNRLAMKVIFFWKRLKLDLNSENAKKKKKNFFVSEIIASQNVAIDWLFQEENACHWQSMG